MTPNHASYRYVALMVLTFLSAHALADGDRIVGTWLTGDGDGWVDIKRHADGISGIIAGSPNDDPPKVRGYIGVPILGRTEIWTRKKE